MIKRTLFICSLTFIIFAVGSVILEHLFPGKFVWHGVFSSSEDFSFWINSFGPWAVVISIIVMIIQTIATPIPLFLVAGANGFIFGAAWGVIITMLGALLGSTLAFYLARIIARDYVSRHLHRFIPQMGMMGNTSGFKFILLARLIPILPSSVVSYAAGLSKISFTGFFIASVFGKLPEIVIYTFLGHSLEKAEGLVTRISLVLIVVSLLFFSFYSKKIYKRNGPS